MINVLFLYANVNCLVEILLVGWGLLAAGIKFWRSFLNSFNISAIHSMGHTFNDTFINSGLIEI